MARGKRKKSNTVPSTVAYDEKRWQREEDARTLANAAAIKKDPERMKAAAKAAKDMLAEEKRRAKELQERASAMAKIAGKVS